MACSQASRLVRAFHRRQTESLLRRLSIRYPEGMEDEDMIATIARDVLAGLEYLHENDSMHRQAHLLSCLKEPTQNVPQSGCPQALLPCMSPHEVS